MKEQANDLQLMGAEEVVRRRPADLFVEDGAEVHLQANAKNSEYFARVRVNAVSDLQILGLVPRGLKEEALHAAVQEDDRAAYMMARELASRGDAAGCSCESRKAGKHQSFDTSFARIYKNIRKSAHPALATLLSDHQRTEFRWDSIHVQSVKGWLDVVKQAVLVNPVMVSLFQDIRIGRQSRLVLDPACVDLLAGGIYIQRTGTLVHRGGYLRIWARHVSRYEDWTTVIIQHDRIPWILEQ